MQLSFNSLSTAEIEEIILMAWADTVPFEAIAYQYDIGPNDLETLMRQQQTPKTYRRWRKRVTRRRANQSKHQALTRNTSTRTKY